MLLLGQVSSTKSCKIAQKAFVLRTVADSMGLWEPRLMLTLIQATPEPSSRHESKLCFFIVWGNVSTISNRPASGWPVLGAHSRGHPITQSRGLCILKALPVPFTFRAVSVHKQQWRAPAHHRAQSLPVFIAMKAKFWSQCRMHKIMCPGFFF